MYLLQFKLTILETLKAICSIWLSRRKKTNSICTARFHLSKSVHFYLFVNKCTKIGLVRKFTKMTAVIALG